MAGFQSGTLLFFLVCCIFSSSSMAILAKNKDGTLAIVYTIAGSDPGGGAGIQADLHAIHSMNCHGCSAITCLTAQNSVGVTGVHAPPASFLKQQLDTLLDDMPPSAVKIGMLGTQELAICVGNFLKELRKRSSKCWVVLDPVMISTSGHKLIDDDARAAMIKHVFPYADILTPNKFEAEELVDRTFKSNADVEQGARDILAMGVAAVLIKGGHTLKDVKYAQDYFLSSAAQPSGEPRLFESSSGTWLRSSRYDTDNTHGTGCTLSSAMASALALGEKGRKSKVDGATTSIDLIDACCLAKAYVTAGIFNGVQLGRGPGPVSHTQFPSSSQHYASLVNNPSEADSTHAFCAMKSFAGQTVDDGRPVLGRILPVVDTVRWVERLAKTPGVTDIQLRIKTESDPKKILAKAIQSQEMCKTAGIRLWINDHWEAAVEAGCFGVHVGQEDLVKCIESGGVDEMRKRGMALGISTHSYAELSAALGVKPSYISLGPVFATKSKSVQFNPQGLPIVSKWRELIPEDIPFVAIGGINDAEVAKQVRHAGADCVAVIGAVTKARDVESAVSHLNDAMA